MNWNLEGIFGVLQIIAEYGTTGMVFLNKYIFSNVGTVAGFIPKIVDFIKNFFAEGGTWESIAEFFKGLFSGDGLSGITDFFKNLF